ncbi:MAG: sodium-translocating pyrophosphatase [Promethearchaeota archaeon]
MSETFILVALIAGIVSILLAAYFAWIVLRKDSGNERMIEVSGYIEKGAKTFIKVQYKVLAVFVICLALIILFFIQSPRGSVVNWEQSIAYVIGSIASMLAGWMGMYVGVKANTRSAQACTKGIKAGFDVAFFGGAFMGLAVVGSALIGISIIYLIFQNAFVVLGFSFGASSIALFMKCGGGIYTKTADVGADLVGKAEYNLPEDDPRNPATIADNVGDNVGDIAGMGSDLFDSYVASILAAMILATLLIPITEQSTFILYPLVFSGVGLISSVISIYLIKWKGSEDPGKSLNRGTYAATLIFAGLAALFALFMSFGVSGEFIAKIWKNYFATLFGLGSGILIGFTSDYFTRDDRKPTHNIAESAKEGHAVVILSGFAYGLISVAPAAIGIVVAMVFSFLLDGIFAIAMAAVGMLSIVGTIVSNDAYGPIVDNARSIAEQGELGEDTIRIADKMDSAGNTAKAITKGFAIGAANLTVIALLFSYNEDAQTRLIDLGLPPINLSLLNIDVLIGAFIGIIVPALFSALLILAVQRNAAKMVDEIRRQFESNPKILTGEEPADFTKTVAIATKGALRELILPSIISIAVPLAVGFLFGVAALGAFLAASILSGFVFAIFMANAGGSWDNAKKWIEDGNLGGKGTKVHKASITGDTVGDPFKDTAGPSINTLLVVMSLTATIFMPLLITLSPFGLIIFPAL